MPALRTPDDRFRDLPGWSFTPHYVEVPGLPGEPPLRLHHVDEGPRGAAPVLMLHGEPSWSYLYRAQIARVAAAGHRAIAPDLIGFGRSDKPARIEDYSYQRHVDWMTSFVEALDLRDITLLCQDWGGLIGLRLVAAMPQRFARVMVANTFLPTGDSKMPEAFLKWREYARTVPVFPVGEIVSRGCVQPLPAAVRAAYDAPFPDEAYKAGARAFPNLVPATPDDPASEPNRQAWQVLMRYERPFRTAFSDRDPITAGADRVLQKLIPGARGQLHLMLAGGGHFLQEDCADALADALLDFLRDA
jgi:haloalkane dehalogenase